MSTDGQDIRFSARQVRAGPCRRHACGLDATRRRRQPTLASAAFAIGTDGRQPIVYWFIIIDHNQQLSLSESVADSRQLSPLLPTAFALGFAAPPRTALGFASDEFRWAAAFALESGSQGPIQPRRRRSLRSAYQPVETRISAGQNLCINGSKSVYQRVKMCVSTGRNPSSNGQNPYFN